MKRITIRLNDKEELELEQFKKKFHIEDDSKALKLGVSWASTYIDNVTRTFFPNDYDLILSKKRKTIKLDRKIY